MVVCRGQKIVHSYSFIYVCVCAVEKVKATLIRLTRLIYLKLGLLYNYVSLNKRNKHFLSGTDVCACAFFPSHTWYFLSFVESNCMWLTKFHLAIASKHCQFTQITWYGIAFDVFNMLECTYVICCIRG